MNKLKKYIVSKINQFIDSNSEELVIRLGSLDYSPVIRLFNSKYLGPRVLFYLHGKAFSEGAAFDKGLFITEDMNKDLSLELKVFLAHNQFQAYHRCIPAPLRILSIAFNECSKDRHPALYRFYRDWYFREKKEPGFLYK